MEYIYLTIICTSIWVTNASGNYKNDIKNYI